VSVRTGERRVRYLSATPDMWRSLAFLQRKANDFCAGKAAPEGLIHPARKRYEWMRRFRFVGTFPCEQRVTIKFKSCLIIT
jgi:hypothetical protein